MRVALFGGSFNPIHNGHLMGARAVLEKSVADEVWFIPCNKHAFDKSLEAKFRRVNMLKLAISGMHQMKLCDVEQEEKSYTINTIRKLRGQYPHEFLWMIGSDILKDIKRWRKYEELVKETEFILFKREGYDLGPCELRLGGIINPNKPISSTQIREKLRKGEPISELVPVDVEEYVRKHKLYM